LKHMPMEEACVASIRAGMDLLEICHSPEMILRAYEALIAEAERSAAFRRLILNRSKDTQRKRTRLFAAPMASLLPPRQFQSLRTKILNFGEQIDEAPRKSDPATMPQAQNALHAETA